MPPCSMPKAHSRRSILGLQHREPSDHPLHPLRAGHLRLCTLLDCILPGRPFLPDDVERICVCTTYSHYWCPPGLGSRWQHASLRAWQISQLGCQPTTSNSRQNCSSSRGRFARSKTSPSRLTTPVSPSQGAMKLGVTLDNILSFSANVKAVTHSCRFMLYNIRRVRPYITQEAAPVLIQALVISHLDYCNSV
ncbi:uncharacterized protein ACWYII_023289 isoform 1-T2 [Salvelinus alpinus]